MYNYYNPNPQGKNVGDCTLRAISKALDISWSEAYAGVTAMGFMLADMPSANYVWGAYLKKNGFTRRLVEQDYSYTVEDFCKDNPIGTYVLALSNHVVCVKDGVYYDSWDSGRELPLYVWAK